MNTFLEDSLQADLDLLKATEKANKAITAHFNLLEHPYRGGPDFRFLYTTDQVKEAIAKWGSFRFQLTVPLTPLAVVGWRSDY